MKHIFIIIIALCIYSCTTKPRFSVKNIGTPAKDSLIFEKVNSIIIKIGKQVTPRPIMSQVLHRDTVESYSLLDNNHIYIYDIKDGVLKDKIVLDKTKVGDLNNYSGYNIISNDSILVYNYRQKIIYLINRNSEIRKKWSITQGKDIPIDPEALPRSPILYNQGDVVVSGLKMGKLDSKFHGVSCRINSRNQTISYVSQMPDLYFKGNFGGVYFNSICHALGNNNTYVYSFSADHNIYIYSNDFSKCNQVYMGSRYAREIKESELSLLEIYKDKNARIKYFIEEHSYDRILYDRYRELYYRVAKHPLNNWTGVGNFLKPFSIIVMDKNLNIIAETPIFEDYKLLSIDNMHVVKNGIIVQKFSTNEDVIEFVKYKIIH